MKQDSVSYHHKCSGKKTQQVTGSASKQSRSRVCFVAIILGRGLTDSMMKEFGQEFRFTTELVQVYNKTERLLKSQEKAAAHTPHIFSGGSHSSKGQTVTEMIGGMKLLS